MSNWNELFYPGSGLGTVILVEKNNDGVTPYLQTGDETSTREQQNNFPFSYKNPLAETRLNF